MLKIFGWSLGISLLALVAGFWYGGWEAFVLVLILGAFEVSISFDNAVLNATILQRMSEFWQKIFLTVGIVIAVFGMRLVFPLAIVWVTAGLDPVRAIDLALNPPANDAPTFPDGSPSYETILTGAHPQIASFGGIFLLMLFLNFVFTQRDITWLTHVENFLAKIGKLDQLAVVICAVVILVIGSIAPADEQATVLVSGLVGLVTFIVVDGLGKLFHPEDQPGPSNAAVATGKAGFFLFMYLEVLDASFSFDGVIGAFAITSDPVIIALGLGLIGAMFVRSITVFLVRKGTLGEYVYLEHGAHWAIGALAFILLLSIKVHVPEIVTGMVGIMLILAAFFASVRRNKREEVEA
ncbi:MAG: DUF475 domain-containing protein [Nocardiaceae bacterium]|nr:DUF475 domain-containing protein [Nocardiaceae bacterium]